MLYNWIEHLRERWGSLAPPPAPSTDAQAATAAGAAGDADAALAAELQAAELLQGVGSEGQAQQRQQRGAANQADKALQESLGWQPPELAGMPQSQLQQRLAEDLLQGCPDLDHSVPGVWRQRRLCPLTHAVPSPAFSSHALPSFSYTQLVVQRAQMKASNRACRTDRGPRGGRSREQGRSVLVATRLHASNWG